MRVLYIIGICFTGAAALLWLGKRRRLSRGTAGFLAFLCLTAGAGSLAVAVLPSGNAYGPVTTRLSELPGQRLSAGRKLIALTFDDGPYPPYTDRLLDLLHEKRVHATFFLVASRARQYPELVRRMAEEGHTIGLHAFIHRDFLALDSREKEKDLREGREVLRSLTGKTPRFWRPPHGFRDPAAMAEAARQGLTAVNWSVSPRDWTGISSSVIRERVLAKAGPGAIIVLHDGDSPYYQASRQAVVEAAGVLIDSLREKGYDLVSLEERQAEGADSAAAADMAAAAEQPYSRERYVEQK